MDGNSSIHTPIAIFSLSLSVFFAPSPSSAPPVSNPAPFSQPLFQRNSPLNADQAFSLQHKHLRTPFVSNEIRLVSPFSADGICPADTYLAALGSNAGGDGNANNSGKGSGGSSGSSSGLVAGVVIAVLVVVAALAAIVICRRRLHTQPNSKGYIAAASVIDAPQQGRPAAKASASQQQKNSLKSPLVTTEEMNIVNPVFVGLSLPAAQRNATTASSHYTSDSVV